MYFFLGDREERGGSEVSVGDGGFFRVADKLYKLSV